MVGRSKCVISVGTLVMRSCLLFAALAMRVLSTCKSLSRKVAPFAFDLCCKFEVHVGNLKLDLHFLKICWEAGQLLHANSNGGGTRRLVL